MASLALIWLKVFLFTAFRYLVFASLAFFPVRWMKEKLAWRKNQERFPKAEDYKREVGYSFGTFVIFGFTGVLIHTIKDYTLIYRDFSDYPMWWFFLSIPVALVIHDAYFYWTHRLMHEWKPIRKYHFVHHESSPPTPYSSLSFHPVEAFVHGFFWFVIAFTLPIPAIWLFVFYSFMFYINMWGHTNYEFWHRDLLTHPVLKILNTPTHHNLHHKYHQANYSIYYNFWDKLCGTNHAEYENHSRSVKAKTELGKTNKLLKMMKL